MATTNNLGLLLVDSSQAQQDVIVNEAFSRLDAKLTESTSIAATNGTNALTEAQVRVNARLVLTSGTASAAFDVVLPAIKGTIIIRNTTAHAATVKCTGGSLAVAVAPGEGVLIYCDGSEAYTVAGAGGGGGATTFAGLTDTPANYTGSGGKAVKVKLDESGLEFGVVNESSASITPEEESGASYTLVLGDAGKMKLMNSASAVTVTVPPGSSVAFPIGTQILLAQFGAGQVTVAAGSGVTINTPETLKLRKRYAQAALVKIDTDLWMLEGNLELSA